MFYLDVRNGLGQPLSASQLVTTPSVVVLNPATQLSVTLPHTPIVVRCVDANSSAVLPVQWSTGSNHTLAFSLTAGSTSGTGICSVTISGSPVSNSPLSFIVTGPSATPPESGSSDSSTSVLLSFALPISGILLLLLLGWLIRERYMRQRATHRHRASVVGAGAGAGGDLLSGKPQEQMLDEIQLSARAELRKAFGIAVFLWALDVSVVAVNWTSVGRLIHQYGASQYVESWIRVAYLVVILISSLACTVNSGAHLLRVRHLWAQLNDHDRLDERNTPRHELSMLQRKISALNISSVSMLFDSLPLTTLNVVRLYLEDDSLGYHTLVLGLLLVGAKTSQLVQLSTLKDQRLKLQYSIYLASRLNHTHGIRSPTAKADAVRAASSPSALDDPDSVCEGVAGGAPGARSSNHRPPTPPPRRLSFDTSNWNVVQMDSVHVHVQPSSPTVTVTTVPGAPEDSPAASSAAAVTSPPPRQNRRPRTFRILTAPRDQLPRVNSNSATRQRRVGETPGGAEEANSGTLNAVPTDQ